MKSDKLWNINVNMNLYGYRITILNAIVKGESPKFKARNQYGNSVYNERDRNNYRVLAFAPTDRFRFIRAH